MFIINRCFKNIWLESQMIHVALFSFQRTTLSFEVCFRLKGFASSDSFIVPHLFQTVKNFFIFLFCLSHPLQQGASNQGAFSCQAGVSRRLVLYYRTRKHLSTVILNFFQKKLHETSDSPRCAMIRKKHRFRDAHLHMAGVAGLEPTHAGFRDPCLTNLAIPLCLSTFIYYTDEYGICQPISFIFFQAYLLHFHSCIVIIYLTNE